MSIPPCNIETILFSSTVIYKCKTCGIIDTTGNGIPCEIRYEVQLSILEDVIKNLELEALADDETATISFEHNKLKNLIGLK